jgi:hypothetical protein
MTLYELMITNESAKEVQIELNCDKSEIQSLDPDKRILDDEPIMA